MVATDLFSFINIDQTGSCTACHIGVHSKANQQSKHVDKARMHAHLSHHGAKTGMIVPSFQGALFLIAKEAAACYILFKVLRI